MKRLLLPAFPQPRLPLYFAVYVDPAFQCPRVPPAQLSPSQRFAALLLQKEKK